MKMPNPETSTYPLRIGSYQWGSTPPRKTDWIRHYWDAVQIFLEKKGDFLVLPSPLSGVHHPERPGSIREWCAEYGIWLCYESPNQWNLIDSESHFVKKIQKQTSVDTPFGTLEFRPSSGKMEIQLPQRCLLSAQRNEGSFFRAGNRLLAERRKGAGLVWADLIKDRQD